MEVTVHPTSQIVELDGRKVRIWEGSSRSGTPVVAFIARIGIDHEKASREEMETWNRELWEDTPPRPVGGEWPRKLVT